MNAKTVFRHGRAIGLVVMLSMWTSSAWAQSLPDLSIEELMKLDAGQVFGASERLQPVLEAPSSVSFITAAEIQRYGYRTLADILRGVRGMYVTDDRNYSLLGTRGFALPGDYNSRILLLVNGHRVNDNVYGQAQVGAEFGLDPALFERVEIIRGPASSLYGDSAVFAVVNVITRTGASLGGGSIALEAGTLGAQLVRATAGHRFASGVDVALSGTYENRDGVGRLYFPAFDTPATNHGVAEGLDGEGVRQFYGRLTFNDLTVTGIYGTRQRDVPTASYSTLFNPQGSPEETTDRHTLIDAEYGRSFGNARATFRTSFDRLSGDGTYPFSGELDGGPALLGRTQSLGTRWTVGIGVTRPFGYRQTVRAGIEGANNTRQNERSFYVDPPILLFDNVRSSRQLGLYVQDEIRFGKWVIVNAGLRYDSRQGIQMSNGEYTRVTPRAALIVLPSSTQSLKYLYGRAFRSPNVFELNTFYFGEQVNDLRPESIDTHEIVWERYVHDWLRTSVSSYWYKADDLLTLRSDAAAFLGTTFVNEGEVKAKGVEIEAQMRLKGNSRALVSYAVQNAVNQQTHETLANSPRHMVKARISLPVLTQRSFVSVEGQYLSSRKTLAGSTVSGVAIVDVNMVHPLGRAWELYGGVRNLFDTQHLDPVSLQHMQDSIPQNGRTARIGLRWKVWGK